MKRNWLNIIIVIIGLLLLNLSIQGQQTYVITVKDAVDIAFKNVDDLKNAKLDYQITDARNKEVTGMAYPQISGSIQGNHYLSLPQIQFPNERRRTRSNVQNLSPCGH